jgi:hypothetical protein
VSKEGKAGKNECAGSMQEEIGGGGGSGARPKKGGRDAEEKQKGGHCGLDCGVVETSRSCVCVREKANE